MTTVGYGDFYPKTHLGRFIVIVACIVGIYFVSMMMVFMTQKSILNETEFKAYKLITRLKLRKEIKDYQSQMIFHCIKMNILKRKLLKATKQEDVEINYNYEKRCIISLIEKIKSKYRAIKTFEFIPTKEQLFDVCERIDTDIKEIKQEIEALKFINDEVINYTDSQIEVVKYLKKNIYATRLMYGLIAQTPIFGKLNDVDQTLLNEDEVYERGSNSDDKKSKKSVISGAQNKSIGEIKDLTIINNNNNNNNRNRFSRNNIANVSVNINNGKDDEEADDINVKPKNNFLMMLNKNVNENSYLINNITAMNNAYNCNNINVPDYDTEHMKDNSKVFDVTNNNEASQLDKEMPSRDIILQYNVSAEEIKSHFEYLFLNPQKPKAKEKKSNIFNRMNRNLATPYKKSRKLLNKSMNRSMQKSMQSNKI